MTSSQEPNAKLLKDVCEEHWNHHLRHAPMEGLGQGRADAKTCFFRESLDDLNERRQGRKAIATRLKAVDPAGLAGQDQISYLMLERQMQLDARLDELDDDLRPNFFPFGPEGALQYAASGFIAATQDDAAHYLERLNSIPQGLRDFAARYEVGAMKGYRTSRHLTGRVLSNVGAMFAGKANDSVLLSPLADKRFANVRAEAESIVERKVYPALAEYQQSLGRVFAKATRDSASLADEPRGEEYYQALVQRHTSLDLSPMEIHRIGREELERIEADLATVAREAGHDGVDAMRNFASSNPAFILRDGVQLRERIEILSKRIDGLIPAFFSRVPRSTYGVRSIPIGLAANSPPAYAQPAPADRSAPGIHWITSIPERCPSYMHVPLALHEAWPGHLMHISLIEEIDGLPAFRRFGAMNYNAYIEGWALYCEGLGIDMQLYDDPYAHFGRLSMEAWRAARLVIDTGLHAFGWSRDRAVALLEKHQAMGRPAAEAEIDRYIGMPAQALSYKLGHIAIRTLRAEAEAQLAEKFSIREFHSQLIDHGAVPLSILNSQVRQWMHSRAAA